MWLESKRMLIKQALCILSVIFICLLIAGQIKAAPPSNFQTTLKIGTGLNSPTGFEIAPDGRIFILQRSGEVKIYKNGQLLPDNFTVLPSSTTGDHGLMGIAFDPDFTNNHYVYFYHSASEDQTSRVVRFDATGDTATGNPYIVFKSEDKFSNLHDGGTIQFGPDGKLYVSIGDKGTANNAQDLSNVRGKILRLNKDGTIPSDNPFVGRLGVKPEIWAYGLRNPFRFQFDSVSGILYEGDVGQDTWEEINIITRGGNFGWPKCEGACSPANPIYIDPIYSYNHNGGSGSISGGPVYRGDNFPSSYAGRLFFADYALGFLKTLTLDAEGNYTGVQDFDTAAGTVVDMKVDKKDGSLYYLTVFPGKLFQVTYANGVRVPVVKASADKTAGTKPLSVQFSSNGTNDPGGLPLSYHWDFGDQSSSNDPNPLKEYTKNGRFIVQLTVDNGTHSALSQPIVIQVGIPPQTTINTPVEGSQYKAGDQIPYTISASDEGTDLADSQVKSTVVLHHDIHIHPFLGPLTGKTGQFAIPTTGEPSANTWYELSTTATDPDGLIATAAANIFPLKSKLSFTSNIPGLFITVDGQPTSTPATVDGVVNFLREIGAPVIQSFNNQLYSFREWSDGGALRHNVAIQSTETTMSASFELSPPFNGEYFTNKTLTGTPRITRQDIIIDFSWGGGSPDPAIPNDNFSARWTKTQYFPAGRYTFTIGSDDGSRLFIDDVLAVNAWKDQSFTDTSKDVDLTAGNHVLRMEYYESGGGAGVRLGWDFALNQPTGSASPTPTNTPSPTPTKTPTPTATATPTPTPTPANLQKLGGMNISAYCSSKGLSSNSQPSGNDWTCGPGGPKVDMNDACRWQYNNPNAFARQDIPNNPYSWNCYVGGGAVTATPTRTPTPLQSPTPSATPTPTPPVQSSYTGKYWNLGAVTFPPAVPGGTPNMIRTDAAINFTWNAGSPDPRINTNNFVVQWSKTHNFESGNYRFTTVSDDGIRVYIDNQLVINQWNDHPMTTHTGTRAMTAGAHTIRVDYYEHGGGAIARFSFIKL